MGPRANLWKAAGRTLWDAGHGARNVLGHPVSTVQVLAGGIFIIACAMVLISWSTHADVARDGSGERLFSLVRVPLVVMGVSVILIVATLHQNILAGVLTLGIIGVLVAPHPYLLRLVHILADPDEPYEAYGKAYEGDSAFAGYGGARSSAASGFGNNFEKEIDRLIKEQVGTDELNPAARQRITQGVAQTLSRQIAEAVQNEGARYPLMQIKRGPEASKELFDEFRDTPFFQRHIEFLTAQGLIEKKADGAEGEWATTALGNQVAEVLSSTLAVSPLKTIDSPVPPEGAPDAVIAVGQSIKGEATDQAPIVWFTLNLVNKGAIKLQVDGGDGFDPEAWIFSAPPGAEELHYNDDGPDGLSSEIAAELEAGSYLIGVRDIIGDPGNFTVMVSAQDN